uniref:7TM_GPCR_Srx domain-containing protein n=1 Tax=Steinernema glaseri TaxID=37863 RepID=A0A1I7YLP1_9BILA
MNVQGYVSTFGFLAQGVLLILFNLPVLIFASVNTKQRCYYGVLLMSLINGLIMGVVSIGYSIFRLIVDSQGRSHDTVPIYQCFYNVS